MLVILTVLNQFELTTLITVVSRSTTLKFIVLHLHTVTGPSQCRRLFELLPLSLMHSFSFLLGQKHSESEMLPVKLALKQVSVP